jgi:hypothetical protein
MRIAAPPPAETGPNGAESASMTVQSGAPGTAASWACAVFAHNEAASILACLESLQAGKHRLPPPRVIVVLANGCTDRTAALVAGYAERHAEVQLAVLRLADKAAAWNHYVHETAPEVAMHVMIDGDVEAAPGALNALAQRLSTDPRPRAVGALPGSGRSRAHWSARMLHWGRLAGGLYALRGSWLVELRTAAVRIPTGLIGEDLFLSALAKERLYPLGLIESDPRLALEPAARFRFRPLSPWRPGDWLTQARREVRYRIRDRQLILLLEHLAAGQAWPADVQQLYQESVRQPGYRWHGRTTPLEWLAVVLMRRDMRRARREPVRGMR